MSPNPIKIGICGKREFESNQSLNELIEHQIREVLHRKSQSSFVGYSMLATGADTVFAEVVLHSFKMPLQPVLPFSDVEYLKDFNLVSEQEKFKNLLENSLPKMELSNEKPSNRDERNEAYYAAGKFVVDHCNIIIFVWDGLKPNGHGGTGDIMGYAQSLVNKELVVIEVLPKKNDPVLDEINKQYAATDQVAVQLKSRYGLTWMISLLAGAAGGTAFAYSLSFECHDTEHLLIAALEFVLILIALGLYFLSKDRWKQHQKLSRHRLKAEKLRLLEAFYQSGYSLAISDYTQNNDPDLAGITQRANTASSESYKSENFGYYIIHSLLRDQLNYHQGRLKHKIRAWHAVVEHLTIILYIALVVVLLMNALSLFLDHQGVKMPWHFNQHLGRFVTILIPVLIGVCESFIHFRGWKILKEQSTYMTTFLKASLQKVEQWRATGADSNTLEQTLKEVATQMLTENNEWHKLILKNGMPGPHV